MTVVYIPTPKERIFRVIPKDTYDRTTTFLLSQIISSCLPDDGETNTISFCYEIQELEMLVEPEIELIAKEVVRKFNRRGWKSSYRMDSLLQHVIFTISNPLPKMLDSSRPKK